MQNDERRMQNEIKRERRTSNIERRSTERPRSATLHFDVGSSTLSVRRSHCLLFVLHSSLCTYVPRRRRRADQSAEVIAERHEARLARRNKIRAHDKSFCILPQSADPVCEIARRHRRRPLIGYSFAAINQPDGKTRARATRSDNFRQNRRDSPTELNRSTEKRRVQKFERHLCADERRL
jgi:hypothetical protein